MNILYVIFISLCILVKNMTTSKTTLIIFVQAWGVAWENDWWVMVIYKYNSNKAIFHILKSLYFDSACWSSRKWSSQALCWEWSFGQLALLQPRSYILISRPLYVHFWFCYSSLSIGANIVLNCTIDSRSLHIYILNFIT